jgi:hypothetical protein
MKEDFSELVQYLDGKFGIIDEKFNSIDEKLLSLGEKLEKKADKSDLNSLIDAVDAYAKKSDAFFQEMVMLSHKVDRHEKWFHQVADKLGIKLEY